MRLALALAWVAAAAVSSPADASIIQWDFEGTLASSNGGKPLVTEHDRRAKKAELVFGSASLGGKHAQTAQFSSGTYFVVDHGLPPGRGGFVDSYTVVMDVRLSRGRGKHRWIALWQTRRDNRDDADWGVDSRGRVGILGRYGGRLKFGRWHRLALVVDGHHGRLTAYVDGKRAVSIPLEVPLSQRWALGPKALLFADNNGQTASGAINSFQIRDEALSATAVRKLGRATAGGIPLPPPPTFTVLKPSRGQTVRASGRMSIVWKAKHPQGNVRLELRSGEALVRTIASVPADRRRYRWRVFPYLDSTKTYTMRVTWRDSDGRSALAESAPFRITGTLPSSSALFERDLVANGSFERGLRQWRVKKGAPTVRLGQRFARTGSQALAMGATDTVVSQDIPLMRLGFKVMELDARPAVDIRAHLRANHPAGRWDDHVAFEALFLGSKGKVLGSTRSLVGEGDTWLERNHRGLLPVGTRKIRLRLTHRDRAPGVSAYVDDVSLRLVPDWQSPPAVITKQPMVQSVRKRSAMLVWETSSSMVDSHVEWGPTAAMRRRVRNIEVRKIDASHWVHVAKLAPLTPGQKIHYRVVSGTAATPPYAFRTGPAPRRPARVAWLADNQYGNTVLGRLAPLVKAADPDLAFFVGDIVQEGHDVRQWQEYWFRPLETASLAQTTPIAFARGNHDGEYPLSYGYSALPGNQAWYAFDIGGARVLVLDSEATPQDSPRQMAWLKAQLASRRFQKATFRIVTFHRLPFSRVWHDDSYNGEVFVRKLWLPLFAQHRVDLVVTGHSHAYQRGRHNGIMHVVVGGAGGRIDMVESGDWSFLKLRQRHHYAIMDVRPNKLSFEAFGLDGLAFDGFELKPRK